MKLTSENTKILALVDGEVEFLSLEQVRAFLQTGQPGTITTGPDKTPPATTSPVTVPPADDAGKLRRGEVIPDVTGMVGDALSFVIPANAFVGNLVSIDVSDLPGLNYDGKARRVYGQLTKSLFWTITVTATDAAGSHAQNQFRLIVKDRLDTTTPPVLLDPPQTDAGKSSQWDFIENPPTD